MQTSTGQGESSPSAHVYTAPSFMVKEKQTQSEQRAERSEEPEDQDTCCEQPLQKWLQKEEKARTMPVSVDTLTWNRERFSVLPLDKEGKQLTSVGRRGSLSQECLSSLAHTDT